MKIFGRNFVKIVVDHAAMALIVNCVILILIGIFGVIAASYVRNQYDYQTFRAGDIRILMGGISGLALGLLLFTGIMKTQKVLLLIYFILSTPGLAAFTIYLFYMIVIIHPHMITSLYFMLLFIFMFILTFAWVTQCCIFLYYKQVSAEGVRLQGRNYEREPTEQVLPLYNQQK